MIIQQMQRKLSTKFNTHLQYIYTKKTSPENQHRRNIPQHNKNHIRQTLSKPYSQWWKNESISSKIRNKTRVPTLTTIIQYRFGSPSHDKQSRKRKEIQIVKEEVKLSLFADDIYYTYLNNLINIVTLHQPPVDRLLVLCSLS